MRWSEWHSKLADLALLAGVAAVATGLTWTVLLDLLLVVGATAAFLAFGYDLNDCCDYAQDRRAGKPVAARPPWQRSWTLAAASGALLAATRPSATTVALGVLALAAGWAYSARPVRLKERGLAGVVGGAIAQRTVPGAVIATTLSLDAAATAALLLWTLAWGARAMIVHQVVDAAPDRRAGMRTWARDRDRTKLQRLLRLLAIIETAALVVAVATAAGLVAAGVAGALIAGIGAALLPARRRRGIAHTWLRFDGSVVHGSYSLGIPAVAAALLVAGSGAAGAVWVAVDAAVRGPSVLATVDVFVDRPELDNAAAAGSIP
jgi:4-hydroxybenzoate polyprenyltransferase